MHEVEGNQKVRIVSIEVAVPLDADRSEVADTLSYLLSELGICDDTNILDWRYTSEEWKVTTPKLVEEGEVFNLPRKRLKGV